MKMLDKKKNSKTLLKTNNLQHTLKLMKRNWLLYLFILPGFIYLIIFNYAPMYGLQIAFRDYKFAAGIWGSEWVGLKHFVRFFNSPRFMLLLKNTIFLSVYGIIISFPLPIFLAVVLNNQKRLRWKKFAQTITYMPHFVSTVVIVGMMDIFFAPTTGIVNYIVSFFGGSGDIYFMGKPEWFAHMYVWSDVWKHLGWNSIIYMAALAGVDQELHEAAMIDGANRLKRVLSIDLPSIAPTIIIMLIMKIGSIMSIGWDKVILMQNDLNLSTSEILSTFVYKQGLLQYQYSYGTAVELFNSVINFTLLVIVNKISAKISETSLW